MGKKQYHFYSRLLPEEKDSLTGNKDNPITKRLEQTDDLYSLAYNLPEDSEEAKQYIKNITRLFEKVQLGANQNHLLLEIKPILVHVLLKCKEITNDFAGILLNLESNLEKMAISDLNKLLNDNRFKQAANECLGFSLYNRVGEGKQNINEKDKNIVIELLKDDKEISAILKKLQTDLNSMAKEDWKILLSKLLSKIYSAESELFKKLRTIITSKEELEDEDSKTLIEFLQKGNQSEKLTLILENLQADSKILTLEDCNNLLNSNNFKEFFQTACDYADLLTLVSYSNNKVSARELFKKSIQAIFTFLSRFLLLAYVKALEFFSPLQ